NPWTLDLISFCHWCLTTITPSSDKFVPPTCGRLAPTSLLLLADYLWLLLLSRSQLLSEACSGQDHAHGCPREWPAPTAWWARASGSAISCSRHSRRRWSHPMHP